MAAAEPELTLYNAYICPFGARAWMTVLALQIPHKFVAEDLRAKSADFTAVYKKALGNDPSSDGKAPTIQLGDKCLTESAIIARFLDANYASSAPYSLFGKDAWDRARIELAIESAGQLIMPFYGFMRSDPDSRPGMLEKLQSIFDKMEALLKDSSESGLFLGGTNFTFFEVAYFPFCDRFCVNVEMPVGGIKFDMEKDFFKDRPRLQNWYESCQASEVVVKMHEMIKEATGEESAHAYFNKVYGSTLIKGGRLSPDQKNTVALSEFGPNNQHHGLVLYNLDEKCMIAGPLPLDRTAQFVKWLSNGIFAVKQGDKDPSFFGVSVDQPHHPFPLPRNMIHHCHPIPGSPNLSMIADQSGFATIEWTRHSPVIPASPLPSPVQPPLDPQPAPLLSLLWLQQQLTQQPRAQ